MTNANPPGPGRRCAICGRIGGTGLRFALRELKAEADRRGVRLRWHSFDLDDAKAHGPCVAREQRRLRANSR